MHIALLSRSLDMRPLAQILRTLRPELRVSEQGAEDWQAADIAVCWNPPEGALDVMPQLRLVHSLGAGVDNILATMARRDAAVCRVVDPQVSAGMAEYVAWGVLHYHRGLDQVLAAQASQRWSRPAQTPAARRTVGILGLGTIGALVATMLQRFGFAVRGWSRSPKQIDGLRSYHGHAELAEFLCDTQILVCLLPLTDSTRGILNAACFEALSKGAVLIHCGRGEHLEVADLIVGMRLAVAS